MDLLPGVIGDRRGRIRRGGVIGVTARRRGVGVPVDPRTVATLNGPARYLLRRLKMNVVDDAGRILGVLKRTIHPMSTHTNTRGTKGAHTATTPPADTDTDLARVPAPQRKHLAQRHYRRA
jgi:hypothetical protein